ncbi:hypothetical protein HPB48_001329 [Haemaphysalis longicornis]|uniref:Uncharacterized protein n=1 Tax=Haemaphysalis longicornis TaxID=44386 RepID=A0A9J6GQD2_HAELO|nr:hypothetical protein HPB48_001329 [Haemaphysalis longicornis]
MFAPYTECMRLNSDDAKFAQRLIGIKVRPTLIIQKLKEESGKIFLASWMQMLLTTVLFSFQLTYRKGDDWKNVHNMRNNNNSGDDKENLLLQMMCDFCVKEQATVIPITDETRSFSFCVCQHAKWTECSKGIRRFLFCTQHTERTSIECPCLLS